MIDRVPWMELQPEAHTKRQATQQAWLPSLLGDGDKGIEIVFDKGTLCLAFLQYFLLPFYT
jgi:hypothetical protein